MALGKERMRSKPVKLLWSDMRVLTFNTGSARMYLSGVKTALIVIAFIFGPKCFATSITGSFSKWYLSGNDYAIDFYFDRVIFEVGDPMVETDGKVWCSAYGCKLAVESEYASGWPMEKYQKQITPYTSNQTVRYDLADFNERVAQASPFTSHITFTRAEISRYKCIKLIMIDGPMRWLLGSTCTGTLPPIEPPPPVPVFCEINGLSNDVIDFGHIENNESRSASISASLFCNGASGVTGNAQLLFTDIGRTGGSAIVLQGAGNNGEIKARMSIGSPSGSNKKFFTVRHGYNETHNLFVNIDSSEMHGKSGNFFGSALLIFEVI
ncbi:hypothetical protein [Serratia entomophila]|nr:hypothetical protein [Serratia entomophila]